MTITPEDEIRALEDRMESSGDALGRGFATLADAHRRAGHLDEAWRILDDGLERYPEFSTAHLVAARVHRERGEADAAADRYGRLLQLDPGNMAGLREAAELAEEDGRAADALALLQRLSGLHPQDAELRGRIRALKERAFGQVQSTGAGPREAAESGFDDEAPEAEVSPDESESAEDFEAAASPRESEAAEDDEATLEDDEAAAGGGIDEDEEVYTRTLAELYARQGHAGRALDVYRHLRAREPDDPSLTARIRELEAAVGAHLDDLEHEWVPGTGADGDEAPPFAWGGDGEAAAEGAADSAADGMEAESSIAEYFENLLSWRSEEGRR